MQSEQGLDVLKMLMGQNELMNFLSGATVMLTSTNKLRQKKVYFLYIKKHIIHFSDLSLLLLTHIQIKKLRKMFNPNEFLHKLSNFPPLRFPLDPHILVTGKYFPFIIIIFIFFIVILYLHL